jgi:hypothetical protein
MDKNYTVFRETPAGSSDVVKHCTTLEEAEHIFLKLIKTSNKSIYTFYTIRIDN